MTVIAQTTIPRLFDDGIFSPSVDDHRAVLRETIGDVMKVYGPSSEREQCFPRGLTEHLGRAGLVRQRWLQPLYGDPGRGVLLAEELARSSWIGLSVGVSLQVETVLSILTRFGNSDLLGELREACLDGTALGCFGASELVGGSDLAGVETTARRTAGGWSVQGEKKYLSLGKVADFALILCHMDDHGNSRGAASLGVVAVPREGLRIKRKLRKVGTHALDTSWMVIEADVPDEAVVARPGMGLTVATWGLTHERLAVAAQTVGACGFALGLATAHLHRRHQFGKALYDHQALRLRLADLTARLDILRLAVYGAATGVPVAGRCGPREMAGLKVSAARFAEEAMSECLQVLGGAGYLEDETPLGRMWRDARLGRLGGGSDEMMWELVAAGMIPDFDSYERAMDFEA